MKVVEEDKVLFESLHVGAVFRFDGHALMKVSKRDFSETAAVNLRTGELTSVPNCAIVSAVDGELHIK